MCTWAEEEEKNKIRLFCPSPLLLFQGNAKDTQDPWESFFRFSVSVFLPPSHLM